MIRYIKQAWGSLVKQPLLSWISIGGTALAIFLIMVIVMTDEVKVAPFAPESNRDRWLVYAWGSIGNKDWGSDGERNTSNGPLGYGTIRKTFYEMETPEAVGAFTMFNTESHLAVKGKRPFGAKRKDTDHGFWKVMDFDFISGSPYSEADVDARRRVAVINESLARKLFDTTDCVGREFDIDHVGFRVCGVVRDVSNLTSYADAELWVPLTATNVDKNTWNVHMGMLSVIILPRSRGEMDAVRQECDRVWDKFGREIAEGGWEFYRRGRPYDQYTAVNTQWANMEPDMESVRRRNWVVYGILLLIPAINLSGMTQSRLHRRREEIGVRRAFGATRFDIMRDIFIESLIITVVAGIIGLGLSLLFLFCGGASVLAGGGNVSDLRLEMVFSLKVFGIAMGFCLLLNIFSALVPSWRAAHTNTVNALAGNNK